MKNKVLVIAKTPMNGGFGTQLFDEDPTCDCCFSNLNLDKPKVKNLINFLVTEDEEFKDVNITNVVISNSFIGSELNFGKNNVYVFKEKHLIRTVPESKNLNTDSENVNLNIVRSGKDEEAIKQMCKILGVDYEEYKKFSKMMDTALKPIDKENLEKVVTDLSTESDITESEIYISPITLHDGSEYNIIENNVFKQPFLNTLKDFHLTNGNDNDDLIIIKNTSADIRVVAELIFKVTSSKSITVIYFGDYYYISCNNSFKEITYQEKINLDNILDRYQGAQLYILNK